MNNDTRTTPLDTKLLILGLLSLPLGPFTAVPGILIGRRQATLSPRGELGYSLCWIFLVVFCIHLVLIGSMILAGMRR
jgi:hypothetical protein